MSHSQKNFYWWEGEGMRKTTDFDVTPHDLKYFQRIQLRAEPFDKVLLERPILWPSDLVESGRENSKTVLTSDSNINISDKILKK